MLVTLPQCPVCSSQDIAEDAPIGTLSMLTCDFRCQDCGYATRITYIPHAYYPDPEEEGQPGHTVPGEKGYMLVGEIKVQGMDDDHAFDRIWRIGFFEDKQSADQAMRGCERILSDVRVVPWSPMTPQELSRESACPYCRAEPRNGASFDCYHGEEFPCPEGVPDHGCHWASYYCPNCGVSTAVTFRSYKQMPLPHSRSRA